VKTYVLEVIEAVLWPPKFDTFRPLDEVDSNPDKHLATL
jgi:hypothetical protein